MELRTEKSNHYRSLQITTDHYRRLIQISSIIRDDSIDKHGGLHIINNFRIEHIDLYCRLLFFLSISQPT